MQIGMKRYGALFTALLPLVPLYLAWRGRRQPDYFRHWGERFAAGCPSPAHPRILLHAVSVGETNAARPLVDELLRRLPEAEILLTHMTPTGRDAGARIVKAHPGRVFQRFLPYDAPGLMERFLDNAAPSMVILMETEVWPRLLAAAARRSIPTVLANARLSDKSLRQTRRALPLMQEAFASFSLVLAQSDGDAQRLAEAGARSPRVMGSLKFDVRPDAAQQALGRQLRSALGRPVWLLASTREGEEAELVAAIRQKPSWPGNPLWLLVPRHPQRFDAVAQLAGQSGIRLVRRSACPRALDIPQAVRADTEMLLGDSMGEMSLYCAMADAALMGGSLKPFGCQNLIEPALAGAPVVVGPSIFNFAHIAQEAIAAGACVQAQDAPSALQALAGIAGLGLEQRRERALAFAQSCAGATDRMASAIVSLWSSR